MPDLSTFSGVRWPDITYSPSVDVGAKIFLGKNGSRDLQEGNSWISGHSEVKYITIVHIVENLSTAIVENPCHIFDFVAGVENLPTDFVEKVSFWMVLHRLWKTYPPPLLKSNRQKAPSMAGVENLSSFNVEIAPGQYW